MAKNITIGRSSDNQIIIGDKSISTHHAVLIIESDGSIKIKDLNSTNGTFVNGRKVTESIITKSDRVTVANSVVDWQSYVNTGDTTSNVGKALSVGRASSNDIVVPHNDVSTFHAKLIKTLEGNIFIQDNASTNGTYVNGQRVGHKQLLPGDRVLLANKYVVDWIGAFEQGRTIVSPAPKPVPDSRFRKKAVVLAPVFVFLVVVLILSFYYIKPLKSYLFPVDINEKYGNTVVLVYHSFLYVVEVEGKELLVTKEEGKLVMYDPSRNTPMAITGTGFFVSEKGEIITNRHVAMPWEYGGEKEQLKESIKNLITSNITDLEGLQAAIKSIGDILVTGRTIDFGIALNDSYLNSANDFIKCVFVRSSNDPEIDVALLQTQDKTLPSKVKNFIDLNEAVTSDATIKDGMEVHMIGYPFGTRLGVTKVGLKPNYQKGTVSQEPGGHYFMLSANAWHGSSGSPILDKKGRLVGVLYSGQEETQGFNRGILAKHAVELIK